MGVLRNVPKTFSFEEQRIEINEIAQDLYDLNVTASGIALTDISVVKPNPTASGSGDVTYDSSNGQFTYTPPELNFLTDLGDAIVDGDFTTAGLMKTDGAGNYSVITDDSSDWNEAHGWGNHANAGYLTGLPAHSHSLVSLSDTSLTGGDAPSDGEALVWDQTNTTWKAGTISSGWQGNIQNSTTANGGGAISFDANTNTLIFQPTEFNYDGTGVAQGKTLRYNGTQWVISEDVSYSQAILGDFSSVQWDLTPTIDGGAGVADSITITAGDNITFSSVTGSGFTIDAEDGVVNINDLGDVDTTGAVNGKILKHNGTKFVIADDASGSTITALNDIGDVNVGTTITDGHVLKWDLATTKWIAGPDLTSSGGSGIALTDISVVKPNPTASGSGDVTYNSTSGQFTYTPPSIPAAQIKSDWDSTTGLSEILNKPTIVENLNDLGDVDTTGAANGKILKHNGTSWVVGTDNDSGGGGGSTSPGGSNTQVQFNDTGSFAGDASLKWDNTNNRLSIGEDATDSYLEVGNGAPGTGGSRFSIRSNNSSNYLYSYAPSMFHIATAGNGGTIQLDWISGTMAHFKKQAECSLYYNNVERIQTTDDGAKIIGGIQDKDGQLGTAGQILSSTGTELDWIDAPTGGGGGTTYNVVSTTADGLAPQLPGSHGGKFLKADGSWEVPAYIANTDTTYSVVDTVNHGLCPVLVAANDKFLRSDGTWADAPGEANVQADWTQTTTTAADYIKNKPGAFGGTASGLVPASTSGQTDKFLRSDGTWQDVSPDTNTTYDLEALLSPGVKLTGSDGTTDNVFFDAGTGISITRTSTSPHTIEFSATGGGATTIDGLTDTNINTSNLGSGQVLQHDGSNWVNADAPSGVPSGTIVMYNSGSAPTGWAVCDGNNGTPDLRGRFIVASGGNISGSGGSADAVLIQHSHEYNFTSSGSSAGAHSHTAGNYGTNNTGSHSHNQSGSGSGSGTTGNQSANHHHTTSTTVNTGSDGNHQHRWGTDDLIGAQGGNNNPDASGGNDWRAWTDSQGAHSHTFNFTHDTLGVSENHTHDFNFNYNIGGSTGNDGSHSHNVTGNTNNTGAHGHSFNLGDVSGQHSSVTVSSGNAPGTNKNLPPYYTLTYIMKL